MKQENIIKKLEEIGFSDKELEKVKELPPEGKMTLYDGRT